MYIPRLSCAVLFLNSEREPSLIVGHLGTKMADHEIMLSAHSERHPLRLGLAVRLCIYTGSGRRVRLKLRNRSSHSITHEREREMSVLIGWFRGCLSDDDSLDWQDKIDDDPEWRATVVRCIVECMRN
jgi:hypothetical protein